MGRRSWWLVGAMLVAAPGGCGHSETEWQAQVRQLDALKTRLDSEHAEAQKARADLDESSTRIEQLKQQLKTAGVDVSNLNANLEAQARATDEYRRRGEQVDALRRRFDLLRAKLAPLTNQGLAVTVRNNRVIIQLPGDTLFDAGREGLKREGRLMLLKVAEVIRGDPSLSGRAYQVAGHLDAAPEGGRVKDAFARSLMRAREVLALLVQPVDKAGGGLNASRWSAAGYGDLDPLQANDSPQAKQANQRCEIIMQPAVEEMLDLKGLGQ